MNSRVPARLELREDGRPEERGCYIDSGAMSYREPTHKPRCAICREWARGSCLRCQRPLCPEHLPDPSQLCSRCTDEFHAASRPRALSAGLFLGLLIPAVAGLLLLLLRAAHELSIAWLDRWLLAVAWVAGLAVCLLVIWTHAHLHRLLRAWRNARFVVANQPRREMRRPAGADNLESE